MKTKNILLLPILLLPSLSVIADTGRLSAHKDNYFLPYYHEETVNQKKYAPLNPNKTDAKDTFIQFQFSFKYKIFGTEDGGGGLYFAYTQKSNWEAYDESAYFRDNDFNPEIFYKLKLGSFDFRLGAEHQSNGAGGINEVSWNRGFAEVKYGNDLGYIKVKPWVRIKDKIDVNPNIETFLSNGELEIALHPLEDKKNKFKLLMRNVTKDYYYYAVSWDVPIYDGLHGYLKYENGYGTSISNYDFKSTAYGAGLALSF